MAITGQGIFSAAFAGNNGVGAISVPGLKTGDRVLYSSVVFPTNEAWQPPGSLLEGVISVDDEIQQKTTDDLTAYTCHVVVLRQV